MKRTINFEVVKTPKDVVVGETTTKESRSVEDIERLLLIASGHIRIAGETLVFLYGCKKTIDTASAMLIKMTPAR